MKTIEAIVHGTIATNHGFETEFTYNDGKSERSIMLQTEDNEFKKGDLVTITIENEGNSTESDKRAFV